MWKPYVEDPKFPKDGETIAAILPNHNVKVLKSNGEVLTKNMDSDEEAKLWCDMRNYKIYTPDQLENEIMCRDFIARDKRFKEIYL